MKISARHGYTKHQLTIENQIMTILNGDGLLLSEIKQRLGLKTSRTMIKDIIDDLVIEGRAEVINPDSIRWRRFKVMVN